jgi:predicted metal-dependent hydrolase
MTAGRTIEVPFGDTRIGFRVQRSRDRQSIAITVNPDATVAVMAPTGVRAARIAAAVQRRAAWIVKQQDWLRRHHPRRPRQFVSGEAFLYLGRQYPLRVVRDPNARGDGIALARGSFWVRVRGTLAGAEVPACVRRLLAGWYRRHAAERLAETVVTFAPRLGVSVVSVRALELRTRWGSGGPDGHLRFNWRIAMAPRRLLEYVVAHELCHIVHNRHSPRFWRLLAQVMPDYEQRRQQLANLGPALDF